MTLKLHADWREWKGRFELAARLMMALGWFGATSTGFAQDTVRVRSTASPRWGADVPLTPVWTIGQIDGPDELAFGMVSAFTVDRTGRFYVYDGKDAQIRQYDANARYVRNIGRKGKGPGEYEWVYGMDIVEDSLLAIHDLSTARVSFFAPDGTLRGSWQEPRATFGFENTFVVDRRGLLYLAVPRRAARGEAPIDESQMTARPSLLLMRRDGTQADSLVLPPHRTLAPREVFYLSTADGGNYNFVATSHHASLRSGGYVFGNGDASRFLIRPTAGPVRIVERAWPRVPVGSAERANWEEYAAHFTQLNGGRGSYTIPSVKPAFRGIVTDHDSRIWVSLYAPARKIDLPPRNDGRTSPRLYWQQPATYEVFSDQGEYLARVVLPMRARFLAARGNRLWGAGQGRR